MNESRAELQLMTIPETARLLAVSRPTVYRLISDGELSPIRLRSHLRVSEVDVRALIERRRENP